MPEEPAGIIQSVYKAIRILKAFGHETPEWGVAELSRHFGWHKSTVSRLLATLEAGGMVERDHETGKYRLGVELIALAGQVTQHADLRTLARPFLDELAARFGETANLTILYRGAAFNIEGSVPAERQVKDIGWVGRRTPPHATSTGKVLLAYLPAAELEQIMAGYSFQRFTPHTIAAGDELMRALEGIRAGGYATAIEELEIGLNSVAAPIFDRSGRAVAAISLSGPAYRMTPARLEEVRPDVVETAQRISALLGWRNSPSSV